MAASDHLGPMFKGHIDAAQKHLHTWDTEDDFGVPMQGAFHEPEWCGGLCEDASHSLVRHLTNSGIEATVQNSRHIDTGKHHAVTRVGDHVIDYTRRQFDGDADVPTIEHISEYQKKFNLE